MYRMVLTGVAAGLIGEAGRPAVFIDDLGANLHSVRSHAPSCLLINLMANEAFRALAPHPGDGVVVTCYSLTKNMF